MFLINEVIEDFSEKKETPLVQSVERAHERLLRAHNGTAGVNPDVFLCAASWLLDFVRKVLIWVGCWNAETKVFVLLSNLATRFEASLQPAILLKPIVDVFDNCVSFTERVEENIATVEGKIEDFKEIEKVVSNTTGYVEKQAKAIFTSDDDDDGNR